MTASWMAGLAICRARRYSHSLRDSFRLILAGLPPTGTLASRCASLAFLAVREAWAADAEKAALSSGL